MLCGYIQQSTEFKSSELLYIIIHIGFLVSKINRVFHALCDKDGNNVIDLNLRMFLYNICAYIYITLEGLEGDTRIYCTKC